MEYGAFNTWREIAEKATVDGRRNAFRDFLAQLSDGEPAKLPKNSGLATLERHAKSPNDGVWACIPWPECVSYEGRPRGSPRAACSPASPAGSHGLRITLAALPACTLRDREGPLGPVIR